MNMTLEQAHEMKVEIERIIEEYLTMFMHEYGMVVEGIDLSLVDITTMDGDRPRYLPKVTIKAYLG